MVRRPTVSVVLPWHQNTRYVFEAINSIKASDGVNIELLLIDDRLNPIRDEIGSLSKATTFSSGYSAAVNAGAKLATGDYVALMNSDDLVHPKRFISQIETLERNQTKLNFAKIRKVNESGKRKLHKSEEFSEEQFLKSSLLISSHLANATLLTKTQYWQNEIKFPEIPHGADWLLSAELSKKFEDWSFLPEEVYFYRQHRKQLTKNSHGISKKIDVAWENLNRTLGLPPLRAEIGTKLIFLKANKTDLDRNFKKDLDSLLGWKKEFSKQYPSLERILTRRIHIYMTISRNPRMLNLLPVYNARSIYWKMKHSESGES